MSRHETTAALTSRVWRTLFDILIRSAPARTKALARRGLTPNDSRALFSLDLEQGRTMRSLADQWKCDPSNATWIVDHLERLGLAKRQPVARDRRVKLVVLTRKGRKTRTHLRQEFHRPPPEFAALDRHDLEALDRVLVKLAEGPKGGSDAALTISMRNTRRQAARSFDSFAAKGVYGSDPSVPRRGLGR